MIHYCKTPEEWARIIDFEELYQGTTLSDNLTSFIDNGVFAEKQNTAQAELEQLLCDRFKISTLRLAQSEYLRYCHAIIIWYHLETNGALRELVETKYNDIKNYLQTCANILAGDGSVINANVPPPGTTAIKNGARVGYRNKPDVIVVTAVYNPVFGRIN